MRGALALLRRLRAEWVAALAVFVLVLVTAFVFAASPRLFNRVADDGLRHELSAASVVERSLEFARADASSVPGGRFIDPDPLGALDEWGEELRGDLPSAVADLVSSGETVVIGPRASVVDPPRTESFLVLRHQSGIDEQIRYVAGREPTGSTTEAEAVIPGIGTGSGQGEGGDDAATAVTVFEIALAASAADELGVSVGDRLYAVIGDELIESWYGVDIVGTYEVVDPDADYWLDDVALQRPEVIPGIGHNTVTAAGLFAPEAYLPLTRAGLAFETRWRFQLDTDRLDAARLPEFVNGIRRLTSEFPSVAPAGGGEPITTLRTGLGRVVDRYLSQRLATEAVLAVVAVGPAAVAAGSIGLVGLLVVARRRGALVLARARGASGMQLVLAELVEAILLVAPAVTLGYLGAMRLVEARSTEWSTFAAVGVGVASVLLLVAATLPVARARYQPSERGEAVAARLSPRRAVFEALVVALAVGGVIALRGRGVGGAGSAGQTVVVDPLVAGTPLLLGLAIGLVTLRAFPLPVRALGWLASLRRDLVPVLGLRRASRQAAAGHLPLLVLVVTVAIGAFSSVMLLTIERGQLDATWREVGADYRVTPGPSTLLPTIGEDAAAGIEAVAVSAFLEASLATTRSAGSRIGLHAIEADAYAAVVAGRPVGAALLGAGFRDEPSDELGTTANPLPAIVSREMPPGTAAMRPGDTFELRILGRRAVFRVVDVRERLAPVLAGETFVLTSRELLRAAVPDRTLGPRIIFVRGDARAEDALRAAIDAQAPAATLDSRAARHAALRDAPLVSAVTGGFALAAVVAVGYAALAVATALALTSSARAQELAQLRTMGLSARGVVGVTVAEQAPGLAMAVVAGTALGISVAWLVEPALRLQAFVGDEAVRLRVDWPAIGLIGLAIVAVAAVGIIVASLLARRLALPTAMRRAQD